MGDVGDRFERLVEIMRVLRAPDGCPWDREQTHATLRPFVLEETYEVLEAIESGDPAQLREELGDYLYEAVFLAQLSEEAGDFTIADSIGAICDKLVRRHPHVFARGSGSDEPLTANQVVEKWETLKAKEREAAGKPAGKPPKTTLSGVPKTLPSLLRAYEISARAAAVGFDWARPDDVVTKIEEEVAEVRQEVEAGALGEPSRAEEEIGDLLFAIANLSRKLGVEPEAALRRATEKFTARFEAMERSFVAQGKSFTTVSLADMEHRWQAVKATESPTTKVTKDAK
jgi:tetrapyrrole methylase family protein/MazG family protein